MKCEKCGKNIEYLFVDVYDWDYLGGSYQCSYPYQETEEDEVELDLDEDWVGYTRSEKEKTETITCPHCGKFPFKQEAIQTFEIVRVVMFKSEEQT